MHVLFLADFAGFVKDYACPFGLLLVFSPPAAVWASSSRRLLQDFGALNARTLRLPRPVVKDYACPFGPSLVVKDYACPFGPFWPLTGLRRHEPVSPVIGALGDSGGRAAPRELRGLREVTVSRAAVVVSRIKGLCLSFSGLFRLSFSGFQLPTADFNVQPSCFRLFPDTQIAFAVVIASPKLTSTRWSIRCPPIGVVIFHE